MSPTALEVVTWRVRLSTSNSDVAFVVVLVCSVVCFSFVVVGFGFVVCFVIFAAAFAVGYGFVVFVTFDVALMLLLYLRLWLLVAFVI